MKALKRTFGLLIAVLLAGSVALAEKEKGRDGGGGNGRNRKISTEGDIYKAIKIQEFFQPQIYKTLKREAIQHEKKPVDAAIAESVQELKKQSLPHYDLPIIQGPRLVYELIKFPKDEQFVSQVNYRIQKEPCLSEGQPSDSSAILPNTVCMSTSRLLARQYAPEEVLSAVTSLAAHEIAHLMRFGPAFHPQIKELEDRVTELVAKVTTEQMVFAYMDLARDEGMQSAWENINNNKNNVVSLCSSIATVLVAHEKISVKLDKISETILSPDPIGGLYADHFIEALFRLMAAQINGCGLQSKDELHIAFKNLFANKQQVSMYDMEFAERKSYGKTSEEEFIKQTCTEPGYCEKLKRSKVNKVPRNNAAALYAELLLVETVYRKYFDTVKSLAAKAELVWQKQ
jgi:hypothetical protein